MPQPSSRAKDIQRAAAAVASLGTMGYYGIGVCIGVAAFLVYRYYHPQDSTQAVSLDPVQSPPGHDHDGDEDDDPGPPNGNSVSANSNTPPNLEDVRSPENPITQWRNDVEHRRTLSHLRRRTNTNSCSVDQSQPTNLNAGGFSTPSTSTGFDSSTYTTPTPNWTLSPTPQVSPMLSGNDGSPPPRRPGPSDGAAYTRRDRAATVTRCLDQGPDSRPPSIRNSTSRTSNPTQQAVRSTPQPAPQHLPVPPIRSLDDGTHGQVGSSLSDDSRSTLSLQSEMEIDWPSILSPGFPHFDLPGLRPGGDDNAPGGPRE